MSKQKTHFEQVPVQLAKKVAALEVKLQGLRKFSPASKGATVQSRTPYVTS